MVVQQSKCAFVMSVSAFSRKYLTNTDMNNNNLSIDHSLKEKKMVLMKKEMASSACNSAHFFPSRLSSLCASVLLVFPLLSHRTLKR